MQTAPSAARGNDPCVMLLAANFLNYLMIGRLKKSRTRGSAMDGRVRRGPKQ